MENKFKPVREVWLGLGLTIFSAVFLEQCNHINQKAAQYPRIMITILLVFSAALLIQGIYFSFNNQKYQARYGKSTQSVSKDVVLNPLLVFALTVMYLAIFHFVNFFVATAIFVPLLMLLFGERKVLRMLLVTVGLELFVYLVFIKLLHVYFPM